MCFWNQLPYTIGYWSSDSDLLINPSSQNRRLFFIFLSAKFRKPPTQNGYQWCYGCRKLRFNFLFPRQVLAEPARYPYLTHLTFSSSDELLLSSNTFGIIVQAFNTALTVRNTNTGTREILGNVAYSVNLTLIMCQFKHSSFMQITFYITFEKSKKETMH